MLFAILCKHHLFALRMGLLVELSVLMHYFVILFCCVHVRAAIADALEVALS